MNRSRSAWVFVAVGLLLALAACGPRVQKATTSDDKMVKDGAMAGEP